MDNIDVARNGTTTVLPVYNRLRNLSQPDSEDVPFALGCQRAVVETAAGQSVWILAGGITCSDVMHGILLAFQMDRNGKKLRKETRKCNS